MAAAAPARAGPSAHELRGMDDVIPSDTRTLRACMYCYLVKSIQQFEKTGCENCPFLDMAADRTRVLKCTSGSFEGVVSLIQPEESWVGKWQGLSKRHRGCYAITVHGKVPDDIVNEVMKHSVRHKPKSNA